MKKIQLNKRQPKIILQRGYVLFTVIVTLFLLASITLLLNRESSMEVSMTASESRVTEARYVAEAGLHHALWQANNANCTGYPSSVASSFGSDNYTVSVSPTSGSPVSITASGTLATGESVSLSRDNQTIYQDPTIMVLQPDPTTVKDGYIDEKKPTFNYGGNSNLSVESDVGAIRNALLQFNLSSIPSGYEITSAKLELRVNASSFDSTPINIHQLTKDWHQDNSNWTDSDTAITWATAGGDFDAAISASAITPDRTQGWVNWDITTLVNGWVNGGVSNYGLILRATGVGTGTRFDSSDSGNSTDRPKLTIQIACECGVACGSAPFICNGNYRDEFNDTVFTGSDGSLDWSGTPWIEVGESDGATNGDILIGYDISNYQLRTRNISEGVEREVDLSGATTASLEYEYRRKGLDSSTDYTAVEISANGAAGPWIELARHQGPANDGSYTLVPPHDITDYISSNTRIRLKTSASMGSLDRVIFDSIEIQCSP